MIRIFHSHKLEEVNKHIDENNLQREDIINFKSLDHPHVQDNYWLTYWLK